MRCLPDVTVASDQPTWVRRGVFHALFDQRDFHCRKVETVEHAYLAEWFHQSEDGRIYFNLPAFQILRGRTEFINGRHRVALLLHYLDPLPMAVTRALYDEDKELMRRVTDRPLLLDQYLELPDLPIVPEFVRGDARQL